ncbi:MAG: hypothetical protein ABSF46_06090 [Terriglobia bacterium]
MTAYAPSIVNAAVWFARNNSTDFSSRPSGNRTLANHIRDRQKILPHAADDCILKTYIGADPGRAWSEAAKCGNARR